MEGTGELGDRNSDSTFDEVDVHAISPKPSILNGGETIKEREEAFNRTLDLLVLGNQVPTCPVCGKAAQYLTEIKDRGLHPPIVLARYSCGLNGHIITPAWSKGGLGEGRDSPSLNKEAQKQWFEMIMKLKTTPVTTAIPVLQDWVGYITRRQQGVLILALRGPDGTRKEHPAKNIIRSLRACVMNSGIDGVPMRLGQFYPHDTFMRMDLLEDVVRWEEEAVKPFFSCVDEYNMHFYQHLLHAAAVLGFFHPNKEVASHWLRFYRKGCHKLHMIAETREQFEHRLRDGDRGTEEE